MSQNILVAYATKTGSTGEIAKSIGETLTHHGAKVRVRPVGEVTDIMPYDAIVLGSPICNGKCMKQLLNFLRDHQLGLEEVPVALFMTSMRLTQISGEGPSGMEVFVDPAFDEGPVARGEMGRLARMHALSTYLAPVLQGAPHMKLVSVAFFKGALSYRKLGLVDMIVMGIADLMQPMIQTGDFRNWEAITRWAESLPEKLVTHQTAD